MTERKYPNFKIIDMNLVTMIYYYATLYILLFNQLTIEN